MLIDELARLIDRFPVITKQPDENTHLVDELVYHWCESVATWTGELLENEPYGSRAQELMNYYIRIFQPGQPARTTYDALVKMLLDGYELIIEKAPDHVDLPVSYLSVDDTGLSIPAKTFAERAIKRIHLLFDNPWSIGDIETYRPPYLASRDPIIISNLECLDDAMECLQSHQEKTSVPTEYQIQNISCSDDGKMALWLHLSYELDNYVKSPGEHRPEPWIWLGVNILGFSSKEEDDVFEAIPKDIQKTIGKTVNPSTTGSMIAFSQIVKNSLDLIEADLRKGCDKTSSITTSKPLEIDVDGLRVRFGESWFNVTDEQARILSILNDSAGKWVMGKDLKYNRDQRVDKIVRRLPEPIRDMINSHTRKGYILRAKT